MDEICDILKDEKAGKMWCLRGHCGGTVCSLVMHDAMASETKQ